MNNVKMETHTKQRLSKGSLFEDSELHSLHNYWSSPMRSLNKPSDYQTLPEVNNRLTAPVEISSCGIKRHSYYQESFSKPSNPECLSNQESFINHEKFNRGAMSSMYKIVFFALIIISCVEYSSGQTGPCPFNMMCTCSYGVPGKKVDRIPVLSGGRGRYTDPSILAGHAPLPLMDLICVGVPLAGVPVLPEGVIEQMDIINSGLEVLDDGDFGEAQVENLRLISNRIRRIGDKAFRGMSHSLKFLDLSHNELSSVPRRPLSHLATLEWLNLDGNHIAELRSEDWTDLRDTLSTLLLGGNNLDSISSDTFRNFRRLMYLSLEKNNILNVHKGVFPETIQTLNLDHNFLSGFPLESVDSLKTLSWLLLRGNLLDELPRSGLNIPKTLDKLDLGENFIRYIPENMFNGSLSVRDLYLDFNVLVEIKDDAFRGINPGRLDLSSNNIYNISDGAFKGGPDTSLVMLDLDKNRLTSVPNALSVLRNLRYLYLPNNQIKAIPKNVFRSFCEHLEALSLSGNQLEVIPRDALENCSMINHLNLGHNQISQINEDDFESWGDNLETLILRNNRLYSIPSRAFRYTPKLNELSLSFNRIVDVSEDSFIDVINSLEILEISFGFYRDDFPEEVLKPLTSLKWIALDNNNFRTVTETALYSFGSLAYFNMDSNRLTEIPKTLFHQNVHKSLADIRLAYNFVSIIGTQTFHNLDGLRRLVLNGNKIEVLSFEAFKTLPNLLTLLVSDNQISSIHDRAFSDLPNLRELDLQKNKLRRFSLTVFANSTNSLIPLSLNLSYNEIKELDPPVDTNIYLKSLDASHNHLEEIPINFLKTFVLSLQKLNLGYNIINKLDSKCLGELVKLQMLILEHNSIQKIRQRAFVGIPSVQFLDLSHNHLKALPHECFSDIRALKSLDLSYNHLRSLPKSVFANTLLETLKLSHNEFVSMPTGGFDGVAKSLHYLDISHNHLEHLDSTMFYSFSNLIELDLAHNKLTILPDNVFVSLTSLLSLDLSANPVRANFKELFHYTQKIQKLNLAHIGFSSSPILPLPNLISLNLSNNMLADIEPHSVESLSQLRQLDISHNKIGHVHSRVWRLLPYLKKLDLSFNPVRSLTKDSFVGASRIETLIIQSLNNVTRFDYDTLSHMAYLKELHMNTFPDIEKYRFHIGQLLGKIHTLQRLHLEIRENALTDQLSLAFGPKIKEIHITGKNLKAIDSRTFEDFHNKNELYLSITETSLQSLPDGLLSHLNDVAFLSLDFRKNNLKYLNPHVLYENASNWESIGTTFVTGGLALDGNDWTCDCSLVWLGQWLRRWLRETLQIHTADLMQAQQVHEIARKATCHEPLTGQKIPLIDIRSEDLSCHASPYSGSAVTPKPHNMITYITSISLVTPLFLLLLMNNIFTNNTILYLKYSVFIIVVVLLSNHNSLLTYLLPL